MLLPLHSCLCIFLFWTALNQYIQASAQPQHHGVQANLQSLARKDAPAAAASKFEYLQVSLERKCQHLLDRIRQGETVPEVTKHSYPPLYYDLKDCIELWKNIQSGVAKSDDLAKMVQLDQELELLEQHLEQIELKRRVFHNRYQKIYNARSYKKMKDLVVQCKALLSRLGRGESSDPALLTPAYREQLKRCIHRWQQELGWNSAKPQRKIQVARELDLMRRELARFADHHHHHQQVEYRP